MTQLPRAPLYAFDPLRLPAPGAPRTERPLTLKQRLFVEEYLVDLNARQAALRAGYKGGSARSNSIARNPRIAAEIRAALDARAERLRVTADRVLLELARVAFSDIGRIIDWSGDALIVRPPGKLSPDDRATIAEIEVAVGTPGLGARIRLHDKQRALAILARHVRLYGPFAISPTTESPAAAAERARALIRDRLQKLAAAQAEEAQELDDRLREAQDPSEAEIEDEEEG